MRNRRMSQERKNEFLSKFVKDNREESDSKTANKKIQSVRCHKCQGYGHYKNEYPNLKKSSNKGRHKALAVTLSDDESDSSTQSDTSGGEDDHKFMTFTSIVTIKSDKEIGKIETDEHNEKSEKNLRMNLIFTNHS